MKKPDTMEEVQKQQEIKELADLMWELVLKTRKDLPEAK